MNIYIKDNLFIFLPIKQRNSRNISEFQKIFPLATVEKTPFFREKARHAFIAQVKTDIQGVWFFFNPAKTFELLEVLDFLETEIENLEDLEKKIIDINEINDKQKIKKQIYSFVDAYNKNIQIIIRLLFFRKNLIESFNFQHFSMHVESFHSLLSFDTILDNYIETFHSFVFYFVRLTSSEQYTNFISDIKNEN